MSKKHTTTPKTWKIQSTVSDFSQEVDTLEEAQLISKYNFLKGYEITSIPLNMVVERFEHFCPSCRKCGTCNHLYSEHQQEVMKVSELKKYVPTGEDNRPRKCTEKKCKCKEFVRIVDV